MPELNSLTPEDLENLHFRVTKMRKEVLELVQEYGYTASQLVSRTLEHDIEMTYGKKILKSLKKETD